MRRTGNAVGTLAVATSLALLGGGLAFADGVVADGDGVAAPMNNNDWAVGSVCTGSSASRSMPVVVTRNGNGLDGAESKVFASGSTVAMTPTNTGPLTVEAGPKNVTLPSNWQVTNSGTSDPVYFNVTYTAPATAGTFSGEVTFTATGHNNHGTQFTRNDKLTVSGTATVCDATAPTASAAGATSAGAYASGAWTKNNVTVTLSGSDNTGGSGLKELRYSTSGTASASSTLYSAATPISVTAEGTTTVSYVAIDNAGNVSDPQSFVVKIDRTAPTVTPGDVAPDGWRSSNVTQSFTASDPGGSGLAAGSPASFTLTASAESADGGATRTEDSQTITDLAGNSVTRKVSGLIDKSAPSISGADESITTWTNQDVTRNYTAEDRKSGLATASDGSFDLTVSADSTRDAAGNVVATRAAKDVLDQVGNKATRVLEAWIDKAKPTLSGAATTSPNGAGWYNGDVSIAWTGSDPLSGIDAATQPLNSSITGEGSNLGIATGPTIKDNAGNTSDAGSVHGINIDRTPPTSQVQGVTPNAVYMTAPTVTCAASDALSLVKTHGSPSGNTAGAGRKTVTCNGATDNADNEQTTASQSVTYTVLEVGSFSKNFDGLSVPKAKAGSVLPLGWAFTDGTSRVQPLTRVEITSIGLTSCTDEAGTTGSEVAEVAAGSSGLQVLTDGSYQVNWKSSLNTGCRRVTVKMFTGPNSTDLLHTRSVSINFTK